MPMSWSERACFHSRVSLLLSLAVVAQLGHLDVTKMLLHALHAERSLKSTAGSGCAKFRIRTSTT